MLFFRPPSGVFPVELMIFCQVGQIKTLSGPEAPAIFDTIE